MSEYANEKLLAIDQLKAAVREYDNHTPLKYISGQDVPEEVVKVEGRWDQDTLEERREAFINFLCSIIETSGWPSDQFRADLEEAVASKTFIKFADYVSHFGEEEDPTLVLDGTASYAVSPETIDSVYFGGSNDFSLANYIAIRTSEWGEGVTYYDEPGPLDIEKIWTNVGYVYVVKPGTHTDPYWQSREGEDLKIWNDIIDKPEFADVALSGSYNDLSDKPSIPVLEWENIENRPTKVSQFTNDSGYQTEEEVQELIDTHVGTVYHPKGSVPTVADLPDNANEGDVYNVEEDGINYAWTGEEWDSLSGTIDLSSYVTKDELSDVATSGDYDDLSNKPRVPIIKTTEDGGYIGFSTSEKIGVFETEDEISFKTYDNTGLENKVISWPKIDLTTYLKRIDLTQEEYDALPEKDPDTLYVTDGEGGGGGGGTVTWADIKDKPTFANVATSGDYADLDNKPDLNTKQDTLISGGNIKTINNQSLLGPGNIDIQSGGNINYDDIIAPLRVGSQITQLNNLRNPTTIKKIFECDKTVKQIFLNYGIPSEDKKIKPGWAPMFLQFYDMSVLFKNAPNFSLVRCEIVSGFRDSSSSDINRLKHTVNLVLPVTITSTTTPFKIPPVIHILDPYNCSAVLNSYPAVSVTLYPFINNAWGNAVAIEGTTVSSGGPYGYINGFKFGYEVEE